MPISISSCRGGPPSLAHAPASQSRSRFPDRGRHVAECSSGLIATLGPAGPPNLKGRRSDLLKPADCWAEQGLWPAHAATIAHTLPGGHAHTLLPQSTTLPFEAFWCRPVVGSRASSRTPSWRAWRRPNRAHQGPLLIFLPPAFSPVSLVCCLPSLAPLFFCRLPPPFSLLSRLLAFRFLSSAPCQVSSSASSSGAEPAAPPGMQRLKPRTLPRYL